MNSANPFDATATLSTAAGDVTYYRLNTLADLGLGQIDTLPYSIRILLDGITERSAQATDLEAARLLLYRAAFALDTGEDAIAESAHAKKFASRVAFTGISQCMQAMGANGYKHEYPLVRHLTCARMANYIDGTTEIQNVVISRDLLGPFV